MNRERVQELRNVIAGIPEKNIRLDSYYTKGGEKPCGTIACIAGWACIYPPFVKAGINRTGMYSPDCSKFFGVPFHTFWERQWGETGTDKEIALKRLDALLK